MSDILLESRDADNDLSGGPNDSPGMALPGPEDILQSFYDSAPMVMGVVEVADNDIIHLSLNIAAARLMGVEPGNMLGKRASELGMPAQNIRRWVEQYRIAEETRQPVKFEYEFRSPAGIRWMSATLAFICTSETGSARCSYCVEDITERRAEDIRRRFLAEASDVLASSLDYEVTLQSVAKLVVPHLADWCVVHLLNDSGQLELMTAMHVDPEKVESARESSRRYPPRMDLPRGPGAVVRTGVSQWTEVVTDAMLRTVARDEEAYRLLAASGMTSYLCVPLIARGKSIGTITFVGAESGHRYTAESLPLAEELARRAAIAVDNARLYAEAHREIRERQRAEAALQESRDYYRTLTEAVPHLVWTTDSYGDADYFSPRWHSYTGFIPATTEDIWARAIHPDDREATARNWSNSLKTGEPFAAEYRLLGSDGTYRWFLARAIPMQSAQGQIVKWFGTSADIDEQKQAEIEIAALNDRLSRSVQETHHRVKNNLQIISALADLQLEDGSATVPSAALVRIGNHTRALAAVHDLLTQRAKTDASAERISISDALDTLVPLLQETTGGRAIRCTVDDTLVTVQESASLALLISELVSNAVKHGTGEITIHLSISRDTACLRVCDDGPGFPHDFEWRSAANTGLGLIDSTARHDLHGEVMYLNRDGGGAEVLVRFPLVSLGDARPEIPDLAQQEQANGAPE